MHEVPEGNRPLAGSPAVGRFSGLGRLLTLLLTLPCMFLLDRPLDFGAAFLLAAVCWLTAGAATNPLPTLAGFIWLGPGIVLVNALAGSPPRFFGLLSTGGAHLGLLLTLRLVWAALLAHSLIRACPRDELLSALRALFRFLRAGERHARTVSLSLELLPAFSTIRVRELRHLPQAIADRIAACDNLLPSVLNTAPPVPGRFRPADTLLIAPAAGLVVFAALVR